MPEQTNPWKRVGEALCVQRSRINPAYKKRVDWVPYAEGLGLTARTVRDLETGARSNYSPVTLALAERIYQLGEGWIRRAVDALAAGGEMPELPAPGGGLLVDAGESDAVRGGEPYLRLADAPPLERGEEIAVWDVGAEPALRAYEFTRQTSTGPATIRLRYPASDPLEQVVGRLRALIVRAQG